MSKKKLKLKGKNTQKLNPKQKEKMQETLDRMQENREVDTKRLRTILAEKLLWTREQKEAGIKNLSQYKKEMEMLQIKLYKLEGIELMLQDILQTQPKEEK